MTDANDPFESPAEREADASRPLWPMVRFLVRRGLLLGVLPVAVGVVFGAYGGILWLVLGWAGSLLLWLPSSFLAASVVFAGPSDDPRALQLADGRLVSGHQFTILLRTRAWEAVTAALLMPVMALGVARVGEGPIAAVVMALTLVPILLLWGQWASYRLGTAAVCLADEDFERAAIILEPLARGKFLARTARVRARLMLAQSLLALGEVDRATEALEGEDHPLMAIARAEQALGKGDPAPAHALFKSLEGSADADELQTQIARVVLALYEQRYADAVSLAESWQTHRRVVTPRTASYLDLLHALALDGRGDTAKARQIGLRRGAVTERWPVLVHLHPKLEELRHELAERLGEHGHQ